jgi:dipeptidyl aminopeptidase/acylaminoacyl peptidase
MKKRFHFTIALSFLLYFFLSGVVAAEEKRLARPDDFVNIRDVSDVQISPDGKLAAFVVTASANPERPAIPRKSRIWLVDVDGRHHAAPVMNSSGCDSSPRWSPDGKHLAFLSRRGTSDVQGETGRQIFILHTGNQDVVKLTNHESDIEKIEWSLDGGMIAFTAQDPAEDMDRKKRLLKDDAVVWDSEHKYSRLWILDLATEKVAKITQEDFHVCDFAWSPDGRELALIVSPTPGQNDILWESSLLIVSRIEKDVVRTLSEFVGHAEAGVFVSMEWSPDGRTICFTEYTPLKIGTWLTLVPAKGGPPRRLLKDYRGTVRKAAWYPDSRHLIADCRSGVRTDLIRIDTESGTLCSLAGICAKHPEFSLSTDEHTIVYLGETPHSANDVWKLESGKKPCRLTNLHPQLNSLSLGDAQEISWKSKRDGLTIYGLIITPPGFEAGKPRPTVVHIHGGPPWSWWMGWHGSWSLWGQLLASNGYVVFLPNPRGSTDQGWRFAQGNLGDWGGGDFRDIMDGIDHLIKSEIADPERLGIGGWSYGGYMSAWAVTQTDRFKAAVVGAGITDLSSFHGTTDINPGFLNIYFPDCSFPCREIFNNHSPMNFLGACKTPVLVLHPTEDKRVPFGQGMQFYNGLKELGLETQMVAYPREGHGLVELAHQRDVLERVLAWFARHIK